MHLQQFQTFSFSLIHHLSQDYLSLVFNKKKKNENGLEILVEFSKKQGWYAQIKDVQQSEERALSSFLLKNKEHRLAHYKSKICLKK